jgi:hypothetical protein
MRAAPATIGGMPRSVKRASAALADQLAFALHHVQRHRGLAVLEGGEVLRARHRHRAVARDDLLDQPAHGLQAQRQRVHVEQQQAARRGAVAGQLVGLDRRAQRHRLVGVDAGQGSRPKKAVTAARTAGMRVEPPTSTTPSTSAGFSLRVAQRAAHRAPACARPGRA